jgi:microcin C transport system substrate-binding protein
MQGRLTVRLIATACVALAIWLLVPPARAEGQGPLYAVSMFGAPKLPPGFTHFPYANPDAPQGGTVTLGALGTFDSFNPYVLRGVPANEITRIYDTLLASSMDEASASYGHIAESIELAPDKLSVAFNLRPEARFHDGTPITAEDVVWTFMALREFGRPQFKHYYADITEVVAESPRRVAFRFRNAENRELPVILGQLAILPKHWWASRDFSKSLTEAPLGSGPYRLESFELGRNTVLARVPDYWARNLPTAKGLYNFGQIRTEYYRDAAVALQAFKAGRIDFRRENISKNWATAYDFPAVEKGWVKRETFKHRLPTGMQGWMMNTRRPIFADARVRHAMAEVFDFEWTNRNLFFGLYTRTESYFSNSELASSGLPDAAELALLDPFKERLPPAVFGQVFHLPITDGSGNNREGLRAALALLKQAGWEIKDRKLVNAAGAQMSFEILVDDPTIERVATPYSEWLKRLGIDVRVRAVDAAQYQRLTDVFDFDMTMLVLPQSEFPGNEQREFFTCSGARAEGSINVAGICDPAIDALVEQVIAAPDRPRQITATRALDRVLLNNWYAVPNWHLGAVWAAYWDRFGHPPGTVRSGMVFDAWWIDPVRAAANDAARSGN